MSYFDDDDDEDEDYGFIAEDEEHEYTSLNDVLESEDINEINKYLSEKNTSKATDNDTFNLAIKINNEDILKKIILLKPNVQNNSLQLAFKYYSVSNNVKIIKIVEREAEKNKVVQKITAEGTNDFIMTKNTELYRLYVNKITNIDANSLNFAICNSPNTTILIDKIVELGGLPDITTLDDAIDTKSIIILKYVIKLNPKANKSTLLRAIKTKNLDIIKIVQDYVKTDLNESALEEFLKYFNEQDLINHSINYRTSLIPGIPKWKTFCNIKLGLKELREIIIKSGINKINNKNVNDMLKSELCAFLDDEYEMHKVTLNNYLYRCKNALSSISSDDDYIIDTDTGMGYCFTREELKQSRENDPLFPSYEAHPYTAVGMSDELIKKIRNYLDKNPKTPSSIHKPYLIGDDIYLEEIKQIFSKLHTYNNLVNLISYETYISLNQQDYTDLFNEILINLDMIRSDFDEFYECTLINKNNFLKKLMDICTDDQKYALSIFIHSWTNDKNPDNFS